MKNIFVINGGQIFAHSGGLFNKTLLDTTVNYFTEKEGFKVRSTDINHDYDPNQEAENYKWADVIIYHTPIWWFQLPNGFKKYIDEVFTAGYNNGIYRSDGRNAENPAINYGTGGLMHGKEYMLTTSWNAPATAFTLPGEFFNQRSVDEGPLFGFHRMNAFTGMQPLESFHFYDIMKNANIAANLQHYQQHLNKLFIQNIPSHENLLNSLSEV
ncbi:NAD(P)H-dependent oxidoreductase [Mucilaginibacter dorajii]|uniref:NAD(P)H-dependent oxidoreductase n=1 Tax=Mucilaginibacter dorajii TaxID=692994 RepID=A0ABP7QU41_9SPHI|nr:NAD(P)H-dependent oxidoreductase [Mucilaginibacter dorajii]MCS3735804.1 modulator of drug activity B [Mucilaginibacter dorajii]